MPIYEYSCDGCGHQFEKLIRPTSGAPDEAIACPSCRGGAVQRLLSAFAVSSDGTRQQHLAHGRKLGAKERRDKQQADVEATLHHDDH